MSSCYKLRACEHENPGAHFLTLFVFGVRPWFDSSNAGIPPFDLMFLLGLFYLADSQVKK
jgi:hypothetical protein